MSILSIRDNQLQFLYSQILTEIGECQEIEPAFWIEDVCWLTKGSKKINYI